MADKSPPARPGGGGGGDRPPRPTRNRGPRKRKPRGPRSNHHNNNKPALQPSLQMPHLKVTVRHIGDVQRHGTVAGVFQLVESLVEQVNHDIVSSQSTTTSSNNNNKMVLLPIHLDHSSMQALVDAEQTANARAVKEKETVKESDGGENEGTSGNDDDSDKTKGKEVASDGAAPGAAAQTRAAEIDEDYACAVKQPNGNESTAISQGPVITVRALYVVPAKKSRRRGERSGCAYLVLTAPEPPEVSLAKTITEKEVTADSSTSVVSISPEDRARFTAMARVQLLAAVEAMSNRAKEDAKSGQQYAGCVVEQALSPKTWREKRNPRYENRTGSVETTADFKRFMEQRAKEEEERMARPKPLPGGGGGSVATSDDVAKNEDGEPISTLVMHLRSKREEAAKLKKLKKKKAKSGSETKEKATTRKSKPTKNAKASNRRGGRKKGGKESSTGGGSKNRNSKPVAMSVLPRPPVGG